MKQLLNDCDAFEIYENSENAIHAWEDAFNVLIEEANDEMVEILDLSIRVAEHVVTIARLRLALRLKLSCPIHGFMGTPPNCVPFPVASDVVLN